jgi:hypothetical protein
MTCTNCGSKTSNGALASTAPKWVSPDTNGVIWLCDACLLAFANWLAAPTDPVEAARPDVPDGAGCTEIWEHTSDRRRRPTSSSTTMSLDTQLDIEVWDLDAEEQVVAPAAIDHIELIEGKLNVEVERSVGQ